MRRILPLFIALACATGCVDEFLGPAQPADHATLFDDVWQEFDLHYSFFELSNINWDSLGAAYRPRAMAAQTDAGFATVLAGMLVQLQDVHVSLTPGSTGSTMGYLSRWDTVPTFFDPAMAFIRYAPGSRFTAGRHLRYGRAAATVGYVRIPSFVGSGWDSEMDEALDSLSGVSRLIIDVRNNAGGNVALAIDIAGRFTDENRRYGYVRLRNGPKHTEFTNEISETVSPRGHHFSGDVYLLTNRRVLSSAEDFVLAMRAQPRARVVGDTTGGASGGPIVRQLANGWTYELSEWMEYTLSHHLFERTGLPPDVVARPTAKDLRDSVDLALQRALTLARH